MPLTLLGDSGRFLAILLANILRQLCIWLWLCCLLPRLFLPFLPLKILAAACNPGRQPGRQGGAQQG
jgi:hypothetical protein